MCIAINFLSPRVLLIIWGGGGVPGIKQMPHVNCLLSPGEHLQGHWGIMVKGKRGVTMTLPKKLLVPSLIVIKVELVCLLGICCACSFTMVLVLVSPKC